MTALRPTVRDAVVTLLRREGLTTLFANPGSTEVPFLADLPTDLRLVLGLHESAAVGMACGHALGTGRPALVNLHTVAGLANACGALVTARQMGAPLVVVVGLQDRRHLELQPFLSGPLEGLAGSYPVDEHMPARAEDVPAAVARAVHLAVVQRGPALVLVPMDDWSHPVDEPHVVPAPTRLRQATSSDPAAAREIADMLLAARSPMLVAGAEADDHDAWQALAALAEALEAPVWQEAFGGRAGFDQSHRLFSGYLPATRGALRQALAPHDLVLVVGGAAFRQYAYEPGAMVPSGTTVIHVVADSREASRSVADVSFIAPVASCCLQVLEEVQRHRGPAHRELPAAPAPLRLSLDGPLSPAFVFRSLASRLPPESVVVEESPSSGPLLRTLVPARAPGSRFSAAGGGLGFAMPAAVGLRMGDPTRPTVCVVGDGSSLYSIQSLWSAAQYGVGVLFIVLANGRYAIMDRLVAAHSPGATAPWPSFPEISIHTLAHGLGCASRQIRSRTELAVALDEIVPTLDARTSPLLLDVAVDEAD